MSEKNSVTAAVQRRTRFDLQRPRCLNDDLALALSTGPQLNPLSIQAFKLYMIVCVAFIGSLGWGFDTSVMSGINGMSQFTEYFGISGEGGGQGIITALLFAIFNFGNIAASFVAGPVADRWGARGNVCSKHNPSRCTLCSLPNKVPWSDMDNQGISTVTAAQSRIYLFFGRFLLGFGSTMNTSSALVPLSNYRLACRLIHWHRPAYVVEISPPQWRGRLAGLHLFDSFGTDSDAILVWIATGRMNSSLSWRIPCAIQFAPTVVLAVGVLFIPEYALNDIPVPTLVDIGWPKRRGTPGSGEYHGNGDVNAPLVVLEWQELEAGIKVDGTDKRCNYITVVFDLAGSSRKNVGSYLPSFPWPWELWWAEDLCGCGALLVAPPKDMLSASFSAFTAKAMTQPALAFLWMYASECLDFSNRAKGLSLFALVQSLCSLCNLFAGSVAFQNIGWKYMLVPACWDVVETIVIYLIAVETKGRTLEELDEIFEDPHPVNASLRRKQGAEKQRSSNLSLACVCIARMIMDTTAYKYIVRLIIRPARESRELITGTVVPRVVLAAVPIQAKPRKDNSRLIVSLDRCEDGIKVVDWYLEYEEPDRKRPAVQLLPSLTGARDTILRHHRCAIAIFLAQGLGEARNCPSMRSVCSRDKSASLNRKVVVVIAQYHPRIRHAPQSIPHARIKWLCSGIMLPVFYAQRRCAPLPVTTPLPPRHRPSAYEPKSCARFARPLRPRLCPHRHTRPRLALPRLRVRDPSRRHAGRSLCPRPPGVDVPTSPTSSPCVRTCSPGATHVAHPHQSRHCPLFGMPVPSRPLCGPVPSHDSTTFSAIPSFYALPPASCPPALLLASAHTLVFSTEGVSTNHTAVREHRIDLPALNRIIAPGDASRTNAEAQRRPNPVLHPVRGAAPAPVNLLERAARPLHRRVQVDTPDLLPALPPPILLRWRQFHTGGACSCALGFAACGVRRFSACLSSSTRRAEFGVSRVFVIIYQGMPTRGRVLVRSGLCSVRSSAFLGVFVIIYQGNANATLPRGRRRFITLTPTIVYVVAWAVEVLANVVRASGCGRAPDEKGTLYIFKGIDLTLSSITPIIRTTLWFGRSKVSFESGGRAEAVDRVLAKLLNRRTITYFDRLELSLALEGHAEAAELGGGKAGGLGRWVPIPASAPQSTRYALPTPNSVSYSAYFRTYLLFLHCADRVFRRFHPVPLKAIFLKGSRMDIQALGTRPADFTMAVPWRISFFNEARPPLLTLAQGSQLDIRVPTAVPPISRLRTQAEIRFFKRFRTDVRALAADFAVAQRSRFLSLRVSGSTSARWTPPHQIHPAKAEIIFQIKNKHNLQSVSLAGMTDHTTLVSRSLPQERARFSISELQTRQSGRLTTTPHVFRYYLKNSGGHSTSELRALNPFSVNFFSTYFPGTLALRLSKMTSFLSLPEEFGRYSISELRPLHPLSGEFLFYLFFPWTLALGLSNKTSSCHYLKNAGLREVRPSTRQSEQSLPQECRRYRNFELRARNGISMISFSMMILHAIALVTTTLLEERGLFSRFDLRARNRAKWIRGLKEGAHIDCTEEAGGIRGALKWRPEVFPSMAAEEVRARLLRGTTSVTSWGGGGTAAIAVRTEGRKVFDISLSIVYSH
ncbi:hypothetical protein B0H14DRAFT_3168259 [Mycena olivaceomarginata]|nr:hypothetical protein B0H14DRAFT_3168259 [Mycena olivaceomarginata]